MKLLWKGHMKEISQLEEAKLPSKAVMFKEPENLMKLNLLSGFFIIPMLILILLTVYLKIQLGHISEWPDFLNGKGALLAILMLIPHELLHAFAYPKNADVNVWYSLKNMIAFVQSTFPVSKNRFIFICLLPSILFGFIPLTIWFFIPEPTSASETLLSFASFSLLMGIGDFLNVFNTLRQMPKGSISQSSGFHTYWYLKV